MSNPAALQGWVKSVDPKSGRAFYANHVTRKTQWDAPEGWVDVDFGAAPSASQDEGDDDASLPSNWETMRDPTTGKPFYVDHERKITTWTKPKAIKTSNSNAASKSHSLQPAVPTPPSSGNHGGFGRSNNAAAGYGSSNYHGGGAHSYGDTGASGNDTNFYADNAFSFSHSHVNAIDLSDWSDALHDLDFCVHSVPDAMRTECPDCGNVFTRVTNRRHHCRLCGDVFCNDCCDTKIVLPPMAAVALKSSSAASDDDGSNAAVSANTPVRVCKACNLDVEQGNFFSMRRYFTPLFLHEPNGSTSPEAVAASSKQVNAALSALTSDLQQMISGLSDTITSIPKETFVTQVCKHLAERETSDRAIQCISTLLGLEAIVASNKQTPVWKVALYQHAVEPCHLFDGILGALERTGSDRKTLYVQEQATKILFYLTEPKTIAAVLQQVPALKKSESVDNKDKDDGKTDDDGDSGEDQKRIHPVELLDLHRAIRSILDHASSNSKYVNLQRWSAACLVNLILEDQRRACMAINDSAAMIASGQEPRMNAGGNIFGYTTFLEELISTGGVLMLTSMVATDDSDTRAHAVGALGAMLASTRSIDASLLALSEMTGGAFGATLGKDGMIVRAIVAGGGCDAAVAQLLLSADNSVAGMGCNFLSSLVMPLLSDPQASQTLSSNYDYRNDQGAVGACREASIELVNGGCLPALISLVRENGSIARPIELRKLGMETLAAVTMSVGNMGSAWAQGLYEEGLERSNAPSKLKDAILMLNEEGIVEAALEVLQSGSGQSFGSDRETPSSRLNECAGIVLGSLTSCSAEAIIELQTRNILSTLLIASNDAGMPVQSTVRGDAAPRCLGIVETVSAVLMFAWQHPSGASSELLDRLIELMDAGVIPYLSKVVNSKIDWESKDRSVGAMKARTASCRLLCCLFGVALTDPTGIGMRRLMEAVDSDSQSYRGGERSPSNIIESTLGVLQKSLNYARASLLGTLNQGPHYHAAIMDLADAALLAIGSMCGSSIAPGGSEGDMVTGESFLATPTADQYAARRTSICRVACDIIVRGSKGGPALLPTMLVGGFGESAVHSSLRLALAIAQNGSKDEHAKLAMSGLLVPISDSLRAALNSGDLYRFSASLAMVRFCGPHVAAGSSGGVQSVRDAIRVATNVLTLPINPESSIEQLDTQDSLKSECIAALESLSHNASLWSSISSEALPAIVQYLHSTALMKSGSSQRQNTRCSALNAVLQIVQVPSHAVAAVQAGIVDPLSKLLRFGDLKDDVPMLALEILHVILLNSESCSKSYLLETGLAKSVCASLGKAATSHPEKPSDKRADVTFLGLELLHAMLSDIGSGLDMSMALSSMSAAEFLSSVASEPFFVLSLCSTLLLKTNMRLLRQDADNSGTLNFDISDKYGPPLIQVPEKCAGYAGTHEAAAGLLFAISSMACAQDTKTSDSFWNIFLLHDAEMIESHERIQLSATSCVHYLSLLAEDCEPFLPLNSKRMDDFVAVTRPLVRYRLLSSLKDILLGATDQPMCNEGALESYLTSLLVAFNVPHICLSLWKDPMLRELAFEVTTLIVELDSEEVIHLFVESQDAIELLFDLLNLNVAAGSSVDTREVRHFLSSVLASLAENGLLLKAIERFDMRGKAIEALAKACVNEDDCSAGEDDEDVTSSRLSTTLMKSLVDLCTIKGGHMPGQEKRLRLSASESEAIARSMGKKVCHMVISRFLERAKLQEYEIDDDDDIMDAPDVAMLCAISQHEEALTILRSLGGLHALSLIAAEGDLLAMSALTKACSGDVSLLLEGETHIAMMSLLADERDTALPVQLECAAFELLAKLCGQSSAGRRAVVDAASHRDCVARAMNVISGIHAVQRDEDLAESHGSLTEEDKKDDDDDDEAERSMGPSPPDYTCIANTSTQDNEDFEYLKVVACLFLSSLVPAMSDRADILADDNFIQALLSLAASNANQLKFASLSTLVALAPFATDDGKFSPHNLADVLLSVMLSDVNVASTANLNANRMFSAAVSGTNIIFDSLQHSRQKEIAKAASTLFQRSVKLCVVTRATANELDKTYSAELSYALSCTLQLIRGKGYSSEIFNQQLLTSMLHLAQWRHDPKTSLGSTSQKHWDASIANCLALVASSLWRPNDVLDAAGIDLKALTDVQLMLARPGKAPRKAMDLQTMLSRLISGPDALLSVSAERILARLFDYR
ncbi:hypothetical protein MPSEU_000837500 [Mayamaea pseudoterrestris]|nr:hypothetical protein MPSEU_000837500 [Mayamaea pseudoterrestris]